MNSAVSSTLTLVIAALPSLARAQSVSLPIRPLGPITVVSKDMLPTITSIRQLPHGRVIANDPVGHRVVLFDSTLSTFTIVADTTSGTNKAYGNQAGGLIPYIADSTLFVDVASLSFVVISPEGKISRVMAVPRTQDVLSMAIQSGGAAFDPEGRLVYRQSFGIKMGQMGITKAAPKTADATSAVPLTPAMSDSSAIVRVDLKTRKVDTVAQLQIQKNQFTTTTLPSGGTMSRSLKNPLPVNDDWALLADGSIAVIRAHDYHIDWISPDGSQRSTPKIAHEWVRLTDSGKVALLDSVKRSDSLAILKGAADGTSSGGGNGAQMVVAFSSDGGGGGIGGGAGGGAMGAAMSAMISDGGGGGTKIVMGNGPGPGAGGPPMPGGLGAGGTNPFGQTQYIAASDLPDYRPAFIGSATGRLETRPDADGNVWIHINTTADVTGGPVYEVVNRKGELVDRVQIPGGCTIVGFAPGIVYLTSRDGTGVRLARARIR